LAIDMPVDTGSLHGLLADTQGDKCICQQLYMLLSAENGGGAYIIEQLTGGEINSTGAIACSGEESMTTEPEHIFLTGGSNTETP